MGEPLPVGDKLSESDAYASNYIHCFILDVIIINLRIN